MSTTNGSSAPTISVVIPTYNRAELLRACLDSVLAQTLQPLEIIVVDDGSSDHTTAMMQSYAPRVTYIQQKNAGPGVARNTGVARATAEYVAFLDSDDLWFPWTLETVADVLRSARPSMVSLAIVPFTDVAEISHVQPSATVATEYRDFLAYAKLGKFLSSNAMVVDRGEFQRVSGFVADLMCCEDLDLTLKMGVSPRFVSIDAPELVAARRTPGSLTRSASQAFKGIQHMYRCEREGRYPGGPERSKDRRAFMTFMGRGKTIQLLLAGMKPSAWQLYRESFVWHLQLGRLKYLAMFPFVATLGLARRMVRFDDVVE